MKIDLNTLLIIGLVIYIVIQSTCNRKEPVIQPPAQITIQRDTLPAIIVNIPPGKSHVIYQPIPANIDSGAIARAYFATVVYNDTLHRDSVDIFIHEKLSRNMIQERNVGVKFNFPTNTLTTIKEIIREPVTRKLLIGLSGDYSIADTSIRFMPFASYQDRKGNQFTAGYNGSVIRIGYGKVIRVR